MVSMYAVYLPGTNKHFESSNTEFFNSVVQT